MLSFPIWLQSPPWSLATAYNLFLTLRHAYRSIPASAVPARWQVHKPLGAQHERQHTYRPPQKIQWTWRRDQSWGYRSSSACNMGRETAVSRHSQSKASAPFTNYSTMLIHSRPKAIETAKSPFRKDGKQGLSFSNGRGTRWSILGLPPSPFSRSSSSSMQSTRTRQTLYINSYFSPMSYHTKWALRSEPQLNMQKVDGISRSCHSTQLCSPLPASSSCRNSSDQWHGIMGWILGQSSLVSWNRCIRLSIFHLPDLGAYM